MDMHVPSGASQISIEATVIRCTCGTPATHPQTPCPGGRDEPLGVVAYWHRNPVRRAFYALTGRTL